MSREFVFCLSSTYLSIKMLGGKIMLSSAAALLSATGVSALVPILDKRQYFPANATGLKTITVSTRQSDRLD